VEMRVFYIFKIKLEIAKIRICDIHF